MGRENATRDERCPWCGAPAEFDGQGCMVCGTPRGHEPHGRGWGDYAIKLVSLVSGVESDMDGKYVKSYEPRRPGRSPTGKPMLVDLQVTDNWDEALHFTGVVAARAEWMRWDGTIRPDGKPSRPMTAFNMSTAKREEMERWT
jgi:hypothetical protein